MNDPHHCKCRQVPNEPSDNFLNTHTKTISCIQFYVLQPARQQLHELQPLPHPKLRLHRLPQIFEQIIFIEQRIRVLQESHPFFAKHELVESLARGTANLCGMVGSGLPRRLIRLQPS